MRETLPKMAPTIVVGIFFAYHMHLGGLYSGDFIVSPLMDWDVSKTTGKRVRMDRIKEMFPEPHTVFPLARAARKRETRIKQLKENLTENEVATTENDQYETGIEKAELEVRAEEANIPVVEKVLDEENDPEFSHGDVVDENADVEPEKEGESEVADLFDGEAGKNQLTLSPCSCCLNLSAPYLDHLHLVEIQLERHD